MQKILHRSFFDAKMMPKTNGKGVILAVIVKSGKLYENDFEKQRVHLV